MLGKKLRRTLILAVTILVVVALTAFYLLANPTPEARFYRDRDGTLLADIRTSANILQLPLTRLTNISMSGNLWVWRAGEWQEERDQFKKIRWNREFGYRAILKIPDKKWKIELRCAPKRAFKLGPLNFSLPYRTNLIFSLEYPARTEIEKSQLPASLPEAAAEQFQSLTNI